MDNPMPAYSLHLIYLFPNTTHTDIIYVFIARSRTCKCKCKTQPWAGKLANIN